jgi:hypothetical protein
MPDQTVNGNLQVNGSLGVTGLSAGDGGLILGGGIILGEGLSAQGRLQHRATSLYPATRRSKGLWQLAPTSRSAVTKR